MNLESNSIVERLEFARQIAREAGELTLRYFGSSDLNFERKSDNTPVTVADRDAETLMRKRIGERFADDGVLGEEHAEKPGTSGFRWILDPIDGTKSFITGVPLYGTLIGVEFEDKSVVGVIEIPALDRRIWAAKGHGAFTQIGQNEPTRAQVSNCQKLEDAVFLTSEVVTFKTRNAADVYDRLEAASWITRTWGDCYGYYLVATGRADLMVDSVMSVWDAAALQPIMEEAGGVFTDWNGNPTIHSGEGIGTSPQLLEQILNFTKS